MTETQQWRLIERTVDAALQLPGDRRRAEVSRLLADQPSLVEPALRWLAEIDTLGAPATPDVPSSTAHFSLDAGTRVGGWAVSEPIGHGGMGEVYRATRASDFDQIGALKLLRQDAGLHAERLVAERQFMADLRHPGIARLLDGGQHTDGRAFLVMDFVDGPSLRQHCLSARPGLQARMQLFLAICDAVNYAHQHLIIHRDIKPSNVRLAADGQPCLLDFGIAKLLEDKPAEVVATVGLMTPAYASPEQLNNAPVTVATDVYGLGALLHFLLTHHAPWRMEEASLPGMLARLAKGEPAVPSKAVGDDPTPPIPATQLRGDLDAIVGKATRPEPGTRYRSVDALRADVEAYLEQRPVAARQGSRRYRFGLYVRRHRWQVAAACLVLLSLVAGIMGTTWQAIRATEERNLAVKEAERADAVLTGVMGMSRSLSGLDDDDDTVKAMRGIAKRVEVEYADDPVTGNTILQSLGNMYLVVGRYQSALPYLQRVIEAYPDHQDDGLLAAARHDLAMIRHRGDGDDTAAQALLDQAVAYWRTKPKQYRQDLLIAKSLQSQLARSRGDIDLAIRLLEEAVVEQEALSGKLNTSYAHLLNDLGALYYRLDRYEDNARVTEEAYEIMVATGSGDSSNAMTVLSNLSLSNLILGRFDKALTMAEKSVDGKLALNGRSNSYAMSVINRGDTLQVLGRVDSAADDFDEALSVAQSEGPGGAMFYASLTRKMALQIDRGQVDAALESAKLMGDEPPDGWVGSWWHSANARRGLALVLDGQLDRAAVELARTEQAFVDEGESGVLSQPPVYRAQAKLAAVQGNLQRAMDKLKSAEEILKARHYDGQWEALEATVERALVARSLGMASAQGDIDSAIAKARERYGDQHAVTARLQRIASGSF